LRSSRIALELNGVDFRYHRPHPRRELKRYVIRRLRAFFVEAGVRDRSREMMEYKGHTAVFEHDENEDILGAWVI